MNKNNRSDAGYCGVDDGFSMQHVLVLCHADGEIIWLNAFLTDLKQVLSGRSLPNGMDHFSDFADLLNFDLASDWHCCKSNMLPPSSLMIKGQPYSIVWHTERCELMGQDYWLVTGLIQTFIHE